MYCRRSPSCRQVIAYGWRTHICSVFFFSGLSPLSWFLIRRCRVFTKFHKPSRCFTKRFFARPNTVLQHFEATQLSACEEMFRNMLWGFWLHLTGWFGRPPNPDVTSLSKQPNDHGSGLLCSMPFLSRLAAPINQCWALMSNKLVTNKFIRVWKVCNRL